VVSTVLMQRLNVAARARDLRMDVYKPLIHDAIGRRLLAPRRADEAPLAVSAEMDDWLRKRSDSMLADVRALEVDVVGDLDDLVPGQRLRGREPSEVTDTELLDVAVDALVALGVEQMQEIRRLRRANQRLQEEKTRRVRGGAGLLALRHRAAGRLRRWAGRVRRRVGRARAGL
jgi:hypothetical protein